MQPPTTSGLTGSYMSHLRAICRRSAIITGMFRLVALPLCLLIACAKSPPADTGGGGGVPASGEKRLNVPGNEGMATKGGATVGGAETGAGDRFKLAADEGKLSIDSPEAKAGGESTIKVTITAGDAFKVNTEFPTKLTLENTQGVTIAKAELKAGGHDKAKGDADVFDEHSLVFAVKVTPAAAGNYTLNGTFKFAVCDKAGSTCLAKKEPIAIQLAAK